MKKYYSVHPEHLKELDTQGLRDNFLIEDIMVKNEITFNYSYEDRNIIGGVYVDNSSITLGSFKDLGTDFFLQRREVGFINTDGEGTIVADGVEFPMVKGDGIYLPMGVKTVEFKSSKSMKLYYNSAPAHHAYEICHIKFSEAKPVHLGSAETMNLRTIYQYIHPNVCNSCQLLMGLTVLESGSCWNTYPPHTHERRMESYFYFDMDEDTRVFEIIGRPEETRHVIMKNEQAIATPSYSIHSGVGTGKYTFIWAMLGENQTFDDMDHINIEDLK